MKRPFSLTAFLLVLVSIIGTGVAFARGSQQNSDIVTGAQIYDRWYAALGVSAPQANMPAVRTRPDSQACFPLLTI